MDEQRVRNDFRLTPAQNRKVKAIAAMRGCTETEVIREAIAQLIDAAESDSELLTTPDDQSPLQPKGGVPR